MNEVVHDVKSCLRMGHAYVTMSVIRCPHRDSYTARVTTFVDRPSDDPEVVFQNEIEFGPFDDLGYIEQMVANLAAVGFSHLMAITMSSDH